MENRDNQHHFKWEVKTSKGVVNVRAKAEINGKTLVLNNYRYQPEGKNLSGLKDEMQSTITELKRRTREQGFEQLELNGRRISGANPNRDFAYSKDLTGGKPLTKEFQLSPDPAVRFGQNATRLRAIEKPYQTKQALELSQAQKGKNQFHQFLQRNPQIEKTQQQTKEKMPMPKPKGKGFEYE